MKIANTMEIRLQNALNIIDDMGCNPGITNTEIAQKRGLSVPTISNIVTILKNSEMVMAAGTGESSGGRKPVRLLLNPQCEHSIGVSVGKHIVYLTLVDFECSICEKEKHYVDFEDTVEYWTEIAHLVQEMQKKCSLPCDVGVALPGFVDYEQNKVYNTHTLGIEMVSLANIYEALGMDVTVGDSCRLAAMGQIFGRNEVEDHFFMLMSRRVSGTVIQNGNIFNWKMSSLDIGAMLIDQNQNQKSGLYGVPGSFSDLCSASRIIDIIKEKYATSRYEDFFDEIEHKNQEFEEIWELYLHYLSMAIYNIYSIFRMNIVIGGEMAKYIEPYIPKLQGNISLISPETAHDIEIQCSVYGEYGEAYGASMEARKRFLRRELPEFLKNGASAAPSRTKK